jgi:hypothetical protein
MIFINLFYHLPPTLLAPRSWIMRVCSQPSILVRITNGYLFVAIGGGGGACSCFTSFSFATPPFHAIHPPLPVSTIVDRIQKYELCKQFRSPVLAGELMCLWIINKYNNLMQTLLYLSSLPLPCNSPSSFAHAYIGYHVWLTGPRTRTLVGWDLYTLSQFWADVHPNGFFLDQDGREEVTRRIAILAPSSPHRYVRAPSFIIISRSPILLFL